jgi:tRNA-uridine 2-sulfurtransferase
MKEKRCLALFSGGLDSLLAIRVMLDQGVEVIPVNFDHGFFFGAYEMKDGVKKMKALLPKEINPVVVDIAPDFYEMIKHPAHGYGSNMNPCIDCKIMMMRKAKELLEKYDAGFVITGEVIGQRPMTQNPQAMVNIEKESGLAGYLLRPLCAKNLEPTEPEKLGWVDREKLLDINGRGRKRQLDMADACDWEAFVKAPAGGCILTDECYSQKLRRMLKKKKEAPLEYDELYLMTVGRQFLKDSVWFMVGRKHDENLILAGYKKMGTLFECIAFPGPAILAIGKISDEMKKFIAAAAAGYSHAKNSMEKEAEIEVETEGVREKIMVKPLDINILQEYRLDI